MLRVSVHSLCALALIGLAGHFQARAAEFQFNGGWPKNWTFEGTPIWTVTQAPGTGTSLTQPMITSLAQGEEGVGIARSAPFTITEGLQVFSLAGADATSSSLNGGSRNFLNLRSYPDGKILRNRRPPGTAVPVQQRWETRDLIGRQVYLELVDGNPRLNPAGFAWIGLAGYRQEPDGLGKGSVQVDNLYGVRIESATEEQTCRTLPFLVRVEGSSPVSTRVQEGDTERIPIGAAAHAIYLLGMINEGWDHAVAHWGEHPELRATRDDQIYAGTKIGEVEIRYAGGTTDRIPLIMGATAWFVEQWAYGPSHAVATEIKEPFVSRPEYARELAQSLALHEMPGPANAQTASRHYYLAIETRSLPIEEIAVINNPAVRGRPLVSAITLAARKPTRKQGAQEASLNHLEPFGQRHVDAGDLKPALKSWRPGDLDGRAERLARCLYTSEKDLPRKIEPVEYPPDFNGTRIRLHGDRFAGMLSNIWTANLLQICEKFPADTGWFHETGKTSPWYGGYTGVGTWAPLGIYAAGCFPRCSDHFASLALRLVDDPLRQVNYYDFVDTWFYFFRNNRDPKLGPPNQHLDAERYPADAPGHWGFGCPTGAPPWQINEIPGEEEMDGHGATIVVRWLVWRHLGAPRDAWLTAPREKVYGKSRWDTTREATEFICWLMDRSGRDVMYNEGETTGWGGLAPWGLRLAADGWYDEKDPDRIRANYANADMYEPYPSFVCLTALRCSVEMAEAIGDTASATRWRAYADRLHRGMLRQLAQGPDGMRTWKQSRFSVYPSMQDSLVQAWFAFYHDGLDPQRLDPEMTAITRNTLHRQLNYPYGHAPVLAMGYGIGWLTKAALVLDELDDAGLLLENIARYSYDKHMDYADPTHGIDWRPYLWQIPEGAHILPDGRWYRIGDLTNGANQGPVMHAMEICAGVDDTKPAELKLMPRVPGTLKGIEVQHHPVLVPTGNGQLERVHVDFSYWRAGGRLLLRADKPLPSLAIRVGPFAETEARNYVQSERLPASTTTRIESSGKDGGRAAWWVWIENLHDVTTLDIGCED